MLPSPAQAQAGSEAASDAAHSKQEASESDTGPVGSNDPCACLPMVLLHAACTWHAKGPNSSVLPPAQGSDEESEASDAAEARQLSTDDPRTTAATIAHFEAEVAPRIAAEAMSEASLEDLRLQTPALRPVGCWCTECARLSPRMQHKAP